MAKCKRTKFFVRLLPSEDFDWDNIKIEQNKEVMYVSCLQDFNGLSKARKQRYWRFQTDGIFYNACQENVYDTVLDRGVFESIFEGVNSVILAFGQTCSGKSFTMGGLQNQYQEAPISKSLCTHIERLQQYLRVVNTKVMDFAKSGFYKGIVPRFISTIFSEIQKNTKEWEIKIGLSFVELMGNSLYDLTTTSNVPCDMKNVSTVKVVSEEQALSVLFKSEGHRKLSCNAPYIGSHCGSAIVTFHFKCLSQTRSNAIVNRSKIHFVDLAGLETVGKRQKTSFKDATSQGAANLIKYELEDAIESMTKLNSYGNIPQTTHSKLISYLGSSFTHGSLMRFIGHIRPTFTDLEVTLSTLKFGQKLKHIPVVPLTYYTEPNKNLMCQGIEEELKQLKEQLLVEKLLNGTGELKSGNFSQSRLAHLNRLAAAYLEGWSSEVNVLGNTDTLIILKIFKELFKQKNEQFEAINKLLSLLTQSRSLIENDTRMSITSRKSRRSKDEIESLRQQKAAKLSIKEIKKLQKVESKMSSLSKPAEQVVQETLKEVSNETNLKKISASRNSVTTPVPVAPDVNESKIWEEFVAESEIDPDVLHNLGESVKKKKIAYESIAAEYTETRIKLENNRVQLKEIGWKRQSGKNELYDRFGQIMITQEEKSLAKSVAELDKDEKATKTLLVARYSDWKDATTDFLEEETKLNEKFKNFCAEKYNANIVLPSTALLDVDKEVHEIELSESEIETNAKNYYHKLHRKLISENAKKKYAVPKNC